MLSGSLLSPGFLRDFLAIPVPRKHSRHELLARLDSLSTQVEWTVEYITVFACFLPVTVLLQALLKHYGTQNNWGSSSCLLFCSTTDCGPRGKLFLSFKGLFS